MAVEKTLIEFTLNGKKIKAEVTADRLLIDLLRDDLGLTGTKKGCGVGECGACTVILDGKTVDSCLVMAVVVDGCNITTIEGLANNGTLHPLQQSFIDHGAVQCGFCTPGMIMSAKALLDENPAPTREEIKVAMSGNVCRCTGYKKIVESVAAVSEGCKGEGCHE
ncbi:Nicotinate dehydrogenase small FeS subunit [Sporomusa ovata DSM 2662]|uniref:Xanthine dehydrogenase iron-sulfur subunit n=1 Tax=Sporomusa ovata TaxID=2378 RepID=A0A0U1KY56_9FIRM|nr:(2Fe-2S)-binding protein [Sporomusa ovata]EQB28934.1 aerobic-type carbon monoxide dehydrogenase, small subunit CoxS/CutS like protein [Sporomusa ovata DSM 2662]CQR72361.1 Xanthine dehydrogenase iron-sulfur subunit [Sporomusa ovata]